MGHRYTIDLHYPDFDSSPGLDFRTSSLIIQLDRYTQFHAQKTNMDEEVHVGVLSETVDKVSAPRKNGRHVGLFSAAGQPTVMDKTGTPYDLCAIICHRGSRVDAGHCTFPSYATSLHSHCSQPYAKTERYRICEIRNLHWVSSMVPMRQ